jgi:gliding motility-associated-like protein
MKKLLLLCLILLLSESTVFSQITTSFRKDYNISLFDLPINSIEGLTPNTYVFAGFHAFNSTVTAVDNVGVTAWSKRFSSGISMYIGDIKKDVSLNRYFVCGGVDSGPAFLLFLDASGNLISGRNFSIAQASGASFNRVIQTSDGGYLCVGTVTGYDPDGAGPEVQFSPVTHNPPECSNSATESIQSPLVVKFDASGNHVWHNVFRYYVGSAAPANRIYNDASFVDVVEISDGYLAVGSYDVNNVFSVYDTDDSGNSCGDDRTPRDAMIAKFSFAGAIEYHRQIDTPSNSTTQTSKGFTSAAITAAGLPLISAEDGTGRPMVLMRFAGSGGFANPTWIQKYGASNVFGSFNPFQPGRFFETSDGNYAVWGYHIDAFAFQWYNVLMKINTSGGSIWSRQYNNGLAAIFPHGEQTSDGGYVGLSYDFSGAGHNLHLMKTDVDGRTSTDCPETNVTVSNNIPSYTWGTPIFNSWNANTVTNGVFTPTIANITPTESTQCLTVVTACTPPPLADNVTATPNPICAGESTTINATGPGVGVSYNVYTAATGGTNLGGVPQVVSPGATTTYYVETVNDSDPLCVSVSRVAIEVVVNAPVTPTFNQIAPICAGEVFSLPTTSTNGYTGSWSPAINNTVTTEYTFTPAGGQCATTATMIVEVSDPITPTFNQIAPICIGDAFTLLTTSINGYTGSWAPAINNTVTTEYTFTPDGGQCATIATMTVEVGDPVIPTFNQVAPICVGDVFTLPTTSTNGYIGSWSPAINNTVTTEYTFNPDAGQCATTATMTVEVGDPVIPTFNQIAPICSGEVLTLQTTSLEGFTGSWSPAANNTATTEYTFNPDAGQCATTATMTVQVNDPVATTFTQVAPICAGDVFTLPSTSQEGFTGTWSPAIDNTVTTEYTFNPDGGQCATTATMTVQVGDPVTPTFNQVAPICEGDVFTLPTTSLEGFTGSWSPAINNTATTEYTFNPDAGQCATAATMTVVVNPSPTATAGATALAVCEGDNIELTANTVVGGTYAWTGPNGFTSADQNPVIPNATAANSGTYSLTISIGTCSSTNTADVAITVNPTPSITVSSNSVVCNGDDLVLTATGGTAYSWTGPNGFTGSSAIETINSPTAANAGIYEVTVTDGNGCSTSAQTTVVISEGPSLTISGTNISCFGDNDGTAEVVATGNGPFSYSWSPSGGTGSTASNLGEGTYTVTVTDNNMCSNSEQITISEPAELTLTTSSTASSCTVNDGSASVVALGGTPGYTYSWSSGGTSSTETGIGAGIYTITVTDANGCTAQENVTVGSVNGPTLTLISSENISCFGANDGSAAVEATGGTPGYTYNWVPSGGNNTSSTGLGAGTYTATVTDDAGCTAAVQVTITEPDALLVAGNATDANCGLNDGAITVNATGGAGSFTYTWTPNAGNTAALSGLSGGTYAVTVEDANGCSVTSSFIVGVSGFIPIDVIPTIATIDAGDNVDLEVIIGGGVTGANITWTPSTGLSCTTCPNPNASPNQTTTYYVSVTTDDGCISSDSVIVFVNVPCANLFVPNIFSPNNDGNNDLLCVYGGCIESFEFAIYSRWGEKVFETTDPNVCWDGNYKGKPMNSETFVYKMIVKLAGETEEILESGNINLVR